MTDTDNVAAPVMLCSILYSRLWGCSCHKIDLLRRPYNKRVQSQPTVVQHHGCQCGRPPKGATRPRFGFLYTSPLSSTSKNCTSISSRSKFKPCALRIAAFRESVAALQHGAMSSSRYDWTPTCIDCACSYASLLQAFERLR